MTAPGIPLRRNRSYLVRGVALNLNVEVGVVVARGDGTGENREEDDDKGDGAYPCSHGFLPRPLPLLSVALSISLNPGNACTEGKERFT